VQPYTTPHVNEQPELYHESRLYQTIYLDI
jgi:hypothetical protein